MSGPSVPSRLVLGYMDPAEYQPPGPWVRFYVAFIAADYRTQRPTKPHGR